MLKIQAEELTNVVVLRLKGHIVRGAEATLRDAVFSQDEASIILLDLSQVDVIDAGGLSALLELRDWTQANGMELSLVNPSELMQRVFAISHLDSVFKISFQKDTPAHAADPMPAIVAASLRSMEHRT